MTKLNTAQAKAALAGVPAWRKRKALIFRICEFKDFAEAMRFVNRVARLAEQVNHHPDIDIRWNRVTLSLTTHDEGGLTAGDFDLARRIDRLVA